MDKALAFWNWFSSNNHRYLFLNEVDEAERNKLLNEILEELHTYDDNLYYEIGANDDTSKIDFIISAGGIIEYFNSVETLVNNAPKFERWNIIGFKPPMPEDHTIMFDGRSFDAKQIAFIPLTSDEAPNDVAIRVCYNDFNKEDEGIFINATFLLLDALIGEKSTALDIDYLDVVKTPENLDEYPYLHLSDIGEYILEIKVVKNN